MIYYALTFLVVALVAGVLGFSGAGGNIAWVLFVLGLALAVVFFVRGRGESDY